MRFLAMALKRLRSERISSLAFAMLVGVTAFGAAATPRLLDRTSDEALAAEVAGSEPGSANVELIEERRIGDLDAVASRGEEHHAAIPPGVRSLFADRYFAVDTPFWSVLTATPEASTIFLRIQQDAEPHITYVDGRPPAAAVRTRTLPEAGTDAPITVLEAALAVPAAEALDVGVGDTVVLGRDPTDPLAADVLEPMAVEVVGTFETIDPSEPYWSGDTEVGEPWIRSVGDDTQFRAAVALLAADAYPSLLESTAEGEPPLRYRWRHLIDPERLDADAAGQLTGELRRMEGLFPAAATASPIQGTLLRSGLLALVEIQQARWRSVEAIVLVVAIGVAAVAGLAFALVASLAVRRRGRALATWIARGATRGQLAAAALVETAVVAIPAAVVAGIAAIALISADDRDGAILAAAVAIVAIGFVVGAVVRAESGPAPMTGSRIARGLRGRRLLMEAVIVLLAVGGATLLRDRGVSAASSTSDAPVTDPLIAAVPALAGVALALVAVRLVPIPMRALSLLAARGSGIVSILGLRRATREATTASVLIVLMMTAMIASFALATLSHTTASGEAVAWHSVGAPFRVTSSSGVISDRLGIGELPGVDSVARAYRTSVAAPGLRGFDVLAVDLASYRSIIAGTPLDDPLPDELLGGQASPLPAIVSSALVADVNGVRIGDNFGVAIRGRTVELRVVATRDSFPTLPVEGRFAVISLTQLEALDPDSPLPTTALFIDATRDAEPALRSAIADASASYALLSRAQENAGFRSAPVTTAMVLTLTAAVAATALFAALAIGASLAVAGAARGGESAHLRAMGLSPRQGVRLVVAEHGSTILIGFVAGTLAGLWLFGILRPGLGFSSLVGSTLEVPLSVDLVAVGAIFVGIAVTAVVGIGLSAVVERSSAPSGAIRRGIE